MKVFIDNRPIFSPHYLAPPFLFSPGRSCGLHISAPVLPDFHLHTFTLGPDFHKIFFRASPDLCSVHFLYEIFKWPVFAFAWLSYHIARKSARIAISQKQHFRSPGPDGYPRALDYSTAFKLLLVPYSKFDYSIE